MVPLRTIATAATLFAAFACGAVVRAADDAAPAKKAAFRIVHRGSVMLPDVAVTREGREVEITGLSGIAWLGDDRYAAIMDNSDTLILFSLPLARDGTPREPRDVTAVTLAERHDYEDVAVCPEPLQERIAARRIRQGFPDPGRCLLVCEEDTPAIRAISLDDGSLLGVIPIPEVFSRQRYNRGLESLHIDADGRHIWTANEEALDVDGPPAEVDVGTVVRLARITIPEPGEAVRGEPVQLAYAVDPPHAFVRLFAGAVLSGVTAVTGLGEGKLLVLERSGCPGLPPFENRIYLIDSRDAADATPIARDLAAHPDKLVPKQLLWRDQLGCNVEGVCLGPRLQGPARTLIAVADNGGVGTPNQVIGFTVEAVHEGVRLPTVVGAAVILAAVLGLALYRLAR